MNESQRRRLEALRAHLADGHDDPIIRQAVELTASQDLPEHALEDRLFELEQTYIRVLTGRAAKGLEKALEEIRDIADLSIRLHRNTSIDAALAVHGLRGKQRRGSKKASENRTKAANDFWARVQPEFDELLASGNGVNQAAEIIRGRIAEREAQLKKEKKPKEWYGKGDRPSLSAVKENLFGEN
jgi:hypothetical protein